MKEFIQVKRSKLLSKSTIIVACVMPLICCIVFMSCNMDNEHYNYPETIKVLTTDGDTAIIFINNNHSNAQIKVRKK
jgi:hypothetical protein